jgi:anti-sigma-K factor RskA
MSIPDPTPGVPPATSKPWWQSKIIWSSAVVILAGLIPLLTDLFKTVLPTAVPVVVAIITFLSGVVILIFRAFFSGTTLE